VKLDRLPYSPNLLVDFYQEGFRALGALCEQTWHDRLEVLAEGPAAGLWNSSGALHEVELSFAPADATAARDASREVFPGCPLTFRLADALRPPPLSLERVRLAATAGSRPPDPTVVERLWRSQFPDTARWRLAGEFKTATHFSLVALARCEVQAIDQHWSLHRLAVALPGGEPDEGLAQEFTFAQAASGAVEDLAWPEPDPSSWQTLLRAALEADLVPDLTAIRARQQSYLRRELERIDQYFANYELELTARANRSQSETTKIKAADRLAAARAEHARRRADQVARHEIRVRPHWEALMLVAEPAWQAGLTVERSHAPQTLEAAFVPRSRRWFV